MPSLPAPNAPQASLTQHTIEAVRNAIHSGLLIPGELYSVYKLAEELGVSRSPAREALLRLAETGMVRFERNRGFRILLPTPHDIAEIFSIRLALEVPAVRRATLHADEAARHSLRQLYVAMQEAACLHDESTFERHDQQLHALLLDIEGNSRTAAIINNLRDATRLVGVSTVGTDRSLLDVLNEHLPIVEAFEAGNPAAAGATMEKHLRETGRLLLRRALLQEGTPEQEEAIWTRLTGGTSDR